MDTEYDNELTAVRREVYVTVLELTGEENAAKAAALAFHPITELLAFAESWDADAIRERYEPAHALCA